MNRKSLIPLALSVPAFVLLATPGSDAPAAVDPAGVDTFLAQLEAQKAAPTVSSPAGNSLGDAGAKLDKVQPALSGVVEYAAH